MGKRGTTFCENAEPVSTISTPYERGTRFTVQVGSYSPLNPPNRTDAVLYVPHKKGAGIRSSTLRIFVRLFQTPAQKIDASAMMRTACSTGAAVRPKGPNGAHRSFQSDQ